MCGGGGSDYCWGGGDTAVRISVYVVMMVTGGEGLARRVCEVCKSDGHYGGWRMVEEGAVRKRGYCGHGMVTVMILKRDANEGIV